MLCIVNCEMLLLLMGVRTLTLVDTLVDTLDSTYDNKYDALLVVVVALLFSVAVIYSYLPCI